MAEFLMRDLVRKRGWDGIVTTASAATSTEEIGNPVHRGTRDKLKKHKISTEGKTAVQLKRDDYDRYDYLIGMDDRNISNMKRIFGSDPDRKIYKLLEFAGQDRDIADPWYTGNFDHTFEDVMEGCMGLLEKIGASL